MATPLNVKRIVIGGLLGGLVANVWSIVMNMALLADRYAEGQAAGHLLESPRYGFFLPAWILILFLIGIGLAWLYAAARNTLGPGPGTALKIGLLVGLVAGFPGNFAQAAWSALPRTLALGWMLDTLGGILLATLVAAWFYRES
jgi:hypothetical protein